MKVGILHVYNDGKTWNDHCKCIAYFDTCDVYSEYSIFEKDINDEINDIYALDGTLGYFSDSYYELCHNIVYDVNLNELTVTPAGLYNIKPFIAQNNKEHSYFIAKNKITFLQKTPIIEKIPYERAEE